MGEKLVAGIGLYEKGRYPGKVGDKQTKEYMLWKNMLNRCRPGGKHQFNHPSYVGCSVHPDFIKFQDFAEWCQHQIGFGNEDWALDKDILIQGNKVYGPDFCCFIPSGLNKLFNHNKSDRGVYPTGVSFFSRRLVFKSEINIDGRSVFLGYFPTPEAAESVYKISKTNEIHRQAELWVAQIDPRVYEALLNYKV